MSDRIPLSELDRLLADDSTPDEELARYFRPAEVRGGPMAGPTLVVNERTVEVPESRGLVTWSLKFLNQRGERRRINAYHQRISSGWKGLKLLAEGDSWFLFPILLKDVVDWLDPNYAIYAVAAAGDTLENMVADVDRLEHLIETHKFDGLIFSGGGNDIAGDPLLSYLQTVADAQAPPDAYVVGTFVEFLSKVDELYGRLFARLTDRFPDLKIFCHGYDWPFPQENGRWLWPAMAARKIPDAARPAILRFMIDGFYGTLAKVAARYPGQVIIVDCRGSVGLAPEWYDELHPRDVGFSRAAARFREAIDTAFRGRETRSAGLEAVKLSWRPHEDHKEGRVRAKIVPIGASVSIGRHADREILLEDDRVSRNHARLEVEAGEVVIEDLGSVNGTFLAGQRITRAPWQAGQELRIGNFLLNFEPVVAPEAPIVRAEDPAPAPQEPAPVGSLARVEIELACGSIVNVEAPAYVVGLFDHVRPTASRGPAREIDLLTDTWLSGLVQSGMFSSGVGRISTLPVTPDRGLKTGLIAFAGLGELTDFGPEALEGVGENLVKALLTEKLPGFATVPIGTNTGLCIADFAASFTRGLVRGLTGPGAEGHLERIVVCELDEGRYAELKSALSTLGISDFFRRHGLELVVTETDVGQSGPEVAASEDVVNQTLIHATSTTPGQYEFYTLPMSGAGLPVWTQLVDTTKYDEIKRIIDQHTTDFDATMGATLASLYLPPVVQQMLSARLAQPESHLLVIHDRSASNIPWEALYFDGRCPALETGISRKCLVHAPRLRHGPLPEESLLRMLVVYPQYTSEDGLSALPGAEDEGLLLARLFKENNGEVTIMSGADANKKNILSELARGGHTILHYAGHAWFDANDPRESGLLLSRRERITAADLDRDTPPPKLIFLNACESSRLRSGASANGSLDRHRSHAQVSGGLAEGLLSIGVENLVGTYWAVDDAAARLFAHAFYMSLLEGKPMSTALRAARRSVKDWSHAGNRMWANYLHFGDPTDRLRSAPPVA